MVEMRKSLAVDREKLLEVAAATLSLLEGRQFSRILAEEAPEEAAVATGPPRDIVANALSAALDWARLEEDLRSPEVARETPAESASNIPYLPSNQVLALLQSAYDEYAEERADELTEQPFDVTDPRWIAVAWEKLKTVFRGKRKFIAHKNEKSFRIELPAQAVVALFSDWGTGEATAQRVMQQIKAARPTHAIHLGDVYHSGTPGESQKRFLDVIAQHGPSSNGCRYLALNSNHEMYSGGYGYFDTTLRQFGQEASYFNLRNSHWQLIGLDSGYEDHGLQDPQKDWLKAQLNAGGKSILLTHHQFFSPFEKRAFDRALHKKITPLLAKVHAWFWGHEHKCIIFGEHLGIKARCIGHGAIPAPASSGEPRFPEIPIQLIDERPAPGTDGEAIHGFALLRFSGAKLDVSYIDEFGTAILTEQL
jgi:hypothetical protein